ncbi:MAG: hypothetical protein M1813_000106 [Trichoglossum hirsutum]|jgi:ribonuclease HI|nr:MAG: hypothetical protein M1813_000106 [Trichoglossum hirsutum]
MSRPIRVFDSDRDPDDIVYYDPGDELSRIGSSIVVAVDGACRGNGTANPNAGYAVFFGPGSAFNEADRLPDTARHTSQRAEIYAAQAAIDVLRTRVQLARHQRIVVVTDSDYLAKSMSEHVYKWVSNGWLNAKGQSVVNGPALGRLHSTICELEAQGKRVRFWRVPRDCNRDADELVNRALDDYGYW